MGKSNIGALRHYQQLLIIKLLLLIIDFDRLMDSLDTFNQPLPSSKPSFYPPVYRNTAPRHEEKNRLIKEIQALIAKNKELQANQQTLQGTVSDLRQLIAVVGKESVEETKHLHRVNGELKAKIGGLSKALKYSYQNGGHMKNCAMYWQQFLQ